VNIQTLQQEETTPLITDGAYGSVENVYLITENNIHLITINLISITPELILSKLELYESMHEVTKCSLGNNTSFYEKLNYTGHHLIKMPVNTAN